jgi:hypothetical protein
MSKGFANFSPEKLRAATSKGGQAKVKKGLAKLSPERRHEIAVQGAKARIAKQAKEPRNV